MKNSFPSLVRGLSVAAERLSMLFNVVGTLVVLMLVLVVNYDVVARGAFNQPFHGAIEVVQFSMVLIVFLQLPDVVRVNRLTRSDGFLLLSAKRFPRSASLLRHFIEAISLVFMTLIAVAIWPQFLEMWESQDYFGVPGVFTAPWWPIKLVIWVSACLCAALFLLKILSPAAKPEMIRIPEFEDSQ